MKINIITRCTRAENLEQVKKSIFSNVPDQISIDWHIIFDTAKINTIDKQLMQSLLKENIYLYFNHCGDFKCQHYYTNKLIADVIDLGYIYILDDDNIIHENFYEKVLEYSDKKVLIFSQWVGGFDFSGLDIRTAKPENVKVGKIDCAQYFVDRDLIVKHDCFYGDGYCADGFFITKLFSLAPQEFAFEKDVLCYYNYITEYGDKDPRSLDYSLESLSVS